jgi:hypothetical protein
LRQGERLRGEVDGAEQGAHVPGKAPKLGDIAQSGDKMGMRGWHVNPIVPWALYFTSCASDTVRFAAQLVLVLATVRG